MMDTKKRYREFCEQQVALPIFSRDWWLDAVCGADQWNVALVEKGGQIMASLPYYCPHRKFFKVLSMPRLTQSLGPYIVYPEQQSYYKRLSWEKELIGELVSSLPKFDHFSQRCHGSTKNWLPFHWLGYTQTTLCSYIIEAEQYTNGKIQGETSGRRRRRSKAAKHGIKIVVSDDVASFYKLNMRTHQRQNKAMDYDLPFLKLLYDACARHSAVRLSFAQDSNGRPIASCFLIYDQNRAYYLAGGIDPDFKDVGAMDALLFDAIEYSLSNGRIFDFEGSMVESIESYFRSFGATQQVYSAIAKTPSKAYRLKEFLKDITR